MPTIEYGDTQVAAVAHGAQLAKTIGHHGTSEILTMLHAEMVRELYCGHSRSLWGHVYTCTLGPGHDDWHSDGEPKMGWRMTWTDRD